VTGSSYDVWRYQSAFVHGIDVGAPPDALFEGGQNWALPPLHPERSREQGHEYFAQCVRAHMRHCGMLRIDHVMGLHRLYWVPSELGATEGLYVRYPAEELYAILLIESQRQECRLVGEDLGTVPDSVRPAMEKAGMHRLYVGQFSTQWREHEQFLGLEEPPPTAIASLDTHDTATFAGWFDTTDLQIDAEHLMRAWTEELAAGPAAGLVITLEDLWLEREPQNRPGTGQDVPNWRHRIARPLDEIFADEHLTGWLRHISDLRSQAQNR
jgi:4-alpha-glucanotransferase